MKNYLSFDIEDWFQVPFASRDVNRSDWETLQSNVVDGTQTILDLLSRRRVSATFFIVGWIAERHPDLVRRIADGGHEIGSHSYAHRPLDELSPEELDKDTALSVEILTHVTGQKPRGYRAPMGSIGDDNAWAIDILRKNGVRYDSSIYPSSPFVYSGMRGAKAAPFEIANGLWEVPLSAETIAGLPIPLSGGFYLRLASPGVFQWLMKRKNARGESCVLYYHPWEFSTSYPRPIRNLPKRFIQYHNLDSVTPKLDRLLSSFEFGPLIDALPKDVAAAA